jgi:hypothetical protein
LPSLSTSHKPSLPLTSQEAADEEYKSEKEEADVFDSDFGDEEVCVKNEAGSSRLLFAPFICAPRSRLPVCVLRATKKKRTKTRTTDHGACVCAALESPVGVDKLSLRALQEEARTEAARTA